MKNRSLFLLILLIFTALFLLCSCKEEETAEEYGLHEGKDGLYLLFQDGEETVRLSVTRMEKEEAALYTAVRPDLDEGLTEAIQGIRNELGAAGTEISVASDWVKRGEEIPAGTKEILLGCTNRPESPEKGSLRSNDYVIRYENGRFVLCGGSLSATQAAAELFSLYFIDRETGGLLIPAGEGYTHNGTYAGDTFLLNGVSLGEYAVSGDADASAKALPGKLYTEITGYAPGTEPSKTIRIDKTQDDAFLTVAEDADGLLLTAGRDCTANFAVRYLVSLLRENAEGQKGELSVTISAKTVTPEEILAREPYKLYVSPSGNDANPGTEDEPLLTLAGAKTRVREVMKTAAEPITVYFREGEYRFSDPVSFDPSDAGTAVMPVTYRAYPGEKVLFSGGITVDPQLIKKAENESILARIPDKAVREKLLQIDLSSLLPVIPDIYSFGHTDNDANRPVEIYVNGTALKKSRYPNEGYLRTTKDPVTTNADGSKTIFYGEDAAERVKGWSEESLADLYLFGFLSYDWTNEAYDASKIDRENNSVTLAGGLNSYFNTIGADKRFYFFNLPEEIDLPYESYIDRENKIAYFLPPDGFDNTDIVVSTLNGSMLKLADTAYLSFEDIEFSYMRANAVYAERVHDITLSGCTVSHTSSKAAQFLESERVTVCGCEIFDCANGGIAISGGDRATLTSCGSVIENCVIHDINRDGSTYGPGIAASGVGMVIRNNHLYGAIHEMIAVGSNDVLIEYNEIDHCVTECSDMGAVYYGRNPSVMGVVIRYNYFHDMGNDYGGTGQFSVYIDDGNPGAEIYGNLFVRASGKQYAGQGTQAAIMHNCAQFSHIHNNIFLDTETGFRFSPWTTDEASGVQDNWYMWLYDRFSMFMNDIPKRCTELGFDGEIWHGAYDGTIWEQLYTYLNTELIGKYADMSDEELRTYAKELGPRETNVIDGNVFLRVGKTTEGSCTFGDNLISDDVSVFRDPENGDFTLTEEGLAKIRETLPGFEAIPLEKIGAENNKK